MPQGYEASLFSLLGVCNISFTWIGSLCITVGGRIRSVYPQLESAWFFFNP